MARDVQSVTPKPTGKQAYQGKEFTSAFATIDPVNE